MNASHRLRFFLRAQYGLWSHFGPTYHALARMPLSTRKIFRQFSISDCYTGDPATGLFRISDGFGKRICDINAWTFEPKMFEDFPDLYRVAPAANNIPVCVGERRGRRGGGLLGLRKEAMKWGRGRERCGVGCLFEGLEMA
ncbi:uncharacterized protein K444DRAFT_32352 [Hyaloscypha bicolor E]|uniref:Uncharacterized protein n=1 Tax=Hyaloscypha bicolor E TaxID=1095630 RepID=A0A2J6T3W4_9HELO|nr:uncharacterized protein K444DRAFT_32352 [Hyaloscypha bicolor E]PMD57686.1 hypothetical protein K444DRAFT_32352 [Hyaloscypha bicolor E]